ncbi:MAG: hypothetical protein IT450_19110 [Phycisphaerales bacterium]|nr:hypothetical protein [Phycisphaerales bacterium]
MTSVVFFLGFAYDRVEVFLYVDSNIDLEITVDETAATFELGISSEPVWPPIFRTREYAGGLIQLKTRLARQSIVLRVPTLVAACLLALFPIVRIVGLARHRDVGPKCVRCDYSLTGNMSGRCPECGEVVTGQGRGVRIRLRRFSREIEFRIAKSILILASTGLVASVAVEAAGMRLSLDSTPNRLDYRLVSVGAGLSRDQLIAYRDIDRWIREPVEEFSRTCEFGVFEVGSYCFDDMEGESLECGARGLFGVVALASCLRLAKRLRNRE